MVGENEAVGGGGEKMGKNTVWPQSLILMAEGLIENSNGAHSRCGIPECGEGESMEDLMLASVLKRAICDAYGTSLLLVRRVYLHFAPYPLPTL